MTATPDQILHDIASRVARRVASGNGTAAALPARYTLLALSGEGAGLGAEIARLAASSEPVVAVADCPAGAAGALAITLARLPRVNAVTGEEAFDAGRVVSGAERVAAPSMDLALASRVAAMQADTPASRAVLRALLHGVPVEASLDERDFAASPLAPAGIREALEEVVARLRHLGVVVHGTPARHEAPAPRASAAAYGAGHTHPSLERFAVPEAIGEIVEFLESRPCTMETDKPCVNCSACDSRGF
jgi:hypothetical protein